jgi:predicted PurR-regulated permease PerM
MIQPKSATERDPSAKVESPVEERVRPGITPVSLLLVLLVAYLLIKVQLVMVLVLLSVLFATVIERPVGVLERKRIPRAFSILSVYIAIIGVITLGSMLVAPTIEEEADRFRADAPVQLTELRDRWREGGNGFLSGTGADALDRAIKQFDDPSAPPQQLTIGIVAGTVGAVVGTLAVLVMAFYYLMEKQFLRTIVISQVGSQNRERVARVWDSVEAQVGRWMRGQLTLCLIIGTASLIGYGAMDIRFWPLLGLWAGLTEIVPIIGPWIGGIPAVIIAMTQSWDKALMVTIFVVLLQLTENTVLVPKVMKGAVGLSPLTVFVAILAGTQYLSVAGALLAIPVAAAVQVIITDYLRGRRGGDAPEPPMPNWKWMRGQLGLSGGQAAPAAAAPDVKSSATVSASAWSSQFFSTAERAGSPKPEHGTAAIPPGQD